MGSISDRIAIVANRNAMKLQLPGTGYESLGTDSFVVGKSTQLDSRSVEQVGVGVTDLIVTRTLVDSGKRQRARVIDANSDV